MKTVNEEVKNKLKKKNHENMIKKLKDKDWVNSIIEDGHELGFQRLMGLVTNVKNRELEDGVSSINIDLRNGKMKVYHGTDGDMLFKRNMYKGEWDELWDFLKRDNPYEIEELS